MKVIETDGDEIVKIHTGISDEHRQNAHRSSSELAFAKWALPPQKDWPGGELPEFIVADDSQQTRGYPALTSEAGGVGQQVFLSRIQADASHRAGLVRLFRIQQTEVVKYNEKRPPLTPLLQLTLSAIDDDFLTDFFDAAIHEALTKEGRVAIRDAETFAKHATAARGTLYEIAEENAGILEGMLEQREAIAEARGQLHADFDTLHDLEMQLEFLFRPGFLQTLDVFGRYPRYLKAMQVRIQRARNNAQTDLRKLAEIEPFQNQLNEKLLECDDIGSAFELIEFAMLLEEFRINRFAPELKTPVKVSARRLEEAWALL
jgi:ATP-dependent helicase HrpA